MNSRWRPGSEIDGAFDLGCPVVHNSAQIGGSDPVTITTDSRPWSYAVAFRLRPGTAEPVPDGVLLVQIDVSVEVGSIGALLVGEDLTTVLSTTAEQSAFNGNEVLRLRADRAPASGWLILRNTALGGAPSQCQLRSIQAFYELAAGNPGSLENLAEVLSEGSDRIDMAKLASVVARVREESRDESKILEIPLRKWGEVPAGLLRRRNTSELHEISDGDLQLLWNRIHDEATTGIGFSVRGWYHTLYAEALRGKRVLDVGSGLGIDGLTFARQGARMTFVDIVQSNLQVLERLCRIYSIPDASFYCLEDLGSLAALPTDFDVIWCQGSMINAPFAFAQRQAKALLEHLPVGGRWIELAYPRERWERDGRPAFDHWGSVTDGPGTPWMEWYDLDRLQARLRPAEFDVVLHFNFHGNDFNWFDLIRRR